VSILLPRPGQTARRWNSRGHCFAAAAEALRRILVDNARRTRRPKHGGDRQRAEQDEACSPLCRRADGLLALNEACGGSDDLALVLLKYWVVTGKPDTIVANLLCFW
jgi:hypothetical protein